MNRRIITITFFLISILINISIISNATNNDINVVYEYNEEENVIIAKIVSNTELKDTKPTWNLSEDKYTYTKIFEQD